MPICKPERNTSFPQGALWIGQGQWQFQGDLPTWKLSSLGCHLPWHCAIVSQASENITAGCPLIANPCFQRWDKFERGFDTNGLSWDVSMWRSLFKRKPHWASRQASTTMHWEGVGGRSNQNGKQSSPLGRQPLFYILSLSLKWAIAFLPRRLRRAMKAKVLQRCSTHLQIYNKIQHDNFFFPGKSLERQSSSSLSASILVFNTLRNMESQRWREKQNQTKNKIETEEKNKTPKQSLITTKTVGRGWGGANSHRSN